MPSLADVITALDRWYPPDTAESWDAVGLTCGEESGPVGRILIAVDCVPATVTEAVEAGAQLLLTHHPLLLGAVHGVPAGDPKGALVHRMIRAGVAHVAAHTNADVAEHGVSESLAHALGLRELRPLVPLPAPARDQLAVLVPAEALEQVTAALSAAGAGTLGRYADCSFTVTVTGTFRPLAGARPVFGEVGELTRLTEQRLSMSLPRARRAAVLAALRDSHPYEEIAWDLSEQPALDGPTGSGRIGVLPAPQTLADFTAEVARRLPPTVWGVRAAGRADQLISTVAVCGGSGGGYADQARAAGADAFVTADLKHHSALEAVTERDGGGLAPMALIDAAHWATEAPWLETVAGLLRGEFGGSVEVLVSGLVTDPWTLHAPSLSQ